MRVNKDAAGFHLTLNPFEGRLLRQCLGSIQKNYRVQPDQADNRLVNCWYSPQGCERSGMSAEEVRQWQSDLHQLRLANLKLVERWLAQLGEGRQGRYQLDLPPSEADSFLSVINDHRLWMATQHAIGEAEMEMHSLRQISKLSAEKQGALYEIHLLAYLMEELLGWLTQ